MPGTSSYGGAVAAYGTPPFAAGGFDFGGLLTSLAPGVGKLLGGGRGGGTQKVTSSQSQALSQNIDVSPQIFVQVGQPSLGSPFTGSAYGGGAAAPSAATANDTQPQYALPANTYGRASINTPYPVGALNGVTTPGFGGFDLAAVASNPLVIAAAVGLAAWLILGKKGKK